jgi:polysaccharide pyruvyl transferase WcaK-like protein
MGVDPRRLEQVPDAVFFMTPPPIEKVQELSRRLGLEQNSFGAITITTSKGAHDSELFEFLETVVQDVLERQIVQQIAVVLQTDGPATSDRVASRAFVDRLSHPYIRLVDADLPPEDLVALYGGAAFTLGCRIHSAIFSVIAGTPAFPISRKTTVKADDIFRTLGLGRFVVRIEGPPEAQGRVARRLVQDIERAVLGGKAARERMFEATARLRKGQDLAVSRLRALRGRRTTE